MKKSIQLPLFEKYAYRVTHTKYAPSLDQFDNPSGPGRVGLNVHKYRIIRETPKGIWIDMGIEYNEISREYEPTKRFVLLTARKKFANPSLTQAYIDYIMRKERQISILSGKINDIKDGISCAKYELSKMKDKEEIISAKINLSSTFGVFA